MNVGAVIDRIGRRGPVPFDAFMELALYGEGGFFSTGGGAGRRADFITSPEVGPLFGAVVARALDAEWDRLDRPDPFVVVEAGAGRGVLARAVLESGPRCAGALRYVLVERSAALRAAAEQVLPVEPAANVLGAVHGGDDDDPAEPAPSGGGPVVALLDDLPAVRLVGVVVANELLDNLPFRILERGDDGWLEVRVGVAAGGDALAEVLVPADPALAAEADRLAPDAPPGGRIPLQQAAVDWLRRALSCLEEGRVLVFDYADTTASMAGRPPEEWLRTYRRHERGGPPIDDPGGQDVTCEVAVDQLGHVRRPGVDVAQDEWLRGHGIEELVAAARAAWHERAHVGDLDALRARSRVGEGDALVDPAGLGAHRVLEWEVRR